MITSENFPELLTVLCFTQETNTQIYSRKFGDCTLKVDVKNKVFLYEDIGIAVNDKTTSNFEKKENFVVFECVCRLLEKGYLPTDLELEPRWKLGHESKSSGKADIWIRKKNRDEVTESLLIIECKTPGEEFEKEWQNTLNDGGQLFSYLQQQEETKFLCLYASDLAENKIIKNNYYLFDMQDDERFIQKLKTQDKGKDKEILTYKDSTNVIVRFNTWRETYNQNYATAGLFENDIQAYSIGRKKYMLEDLQEVDSEEIKRKYNEYAVILRQHNIGTGENAFDKLVNLFLAKIVDETQNEEGKDEDGNIVDSLKVYWKGETADDDYSLQDRLQLLYTQGMKKYLGEEITYISEKQIEDTFEKFKTDKDAVKDKVKEYFRQLKFYSNNDFAFISVYNENLFKKNAVILKKVVQMIQNIRLKSKNNNQFLGDLFEGFLSKGVKQDEGQFFTPMPIVRFMVSSLPLENLLKTKSELKCIDYACGAAHFLTEYASQVKAIIKDKNLAINFADICANITGVEKQDRLAKVAKVSAFMYGNDDINIICDDALHQSDLVENGDKIAENKKIIKDNYDILITNPPFAVAGFLDSLNKTDKSSYTLFDPKMKNIEKKDAIETFFLERAEQILHSGGVAAIILPSSILTKNALYTKAREVIFKNFEIVAIVHLKGVFWKTGTEIAILFLRRRERIVPESLHYEYRIENWFSGKAEDEYSNEVYADKETLLDAYCSHCGYDINEYKSFIANGDIPSGETFASYKKYVGGKLSNDAIKKINECKAKLKKADEALNKTAKEVDEAKSDAQKQKANEKAQKAQDGLKLAKDNLEATAKKKENLLRDFATEVEREKLYYFILCYTQKQNVLVVESPAKTAEIQNFLGYFWSNRKGQEGMHYVNVEKTAEKKANKEEKTEGDADDETADNTMAELAEIQKIQTPLFDPQNFSKEGKINTLIRNNFLGKPLPIPENLAPFAKYVPLCDMIDFSGLEFNKEIKLNAVASGQWSEYSGQFKSVKLGEVAEIEYGTRIVKSSAKGDKYPVYGGGGETFRTDDFNRENRYIISRFGMSPTCVRFVAGKFFLNDSGLTVKSTSEKLLSNFLDVYLCNIQPQIYMLGRGTSQKNMDMTGFNALPLPLPPLSVQKRIVAECEAIDAEAKKAREVVDKGQKEIERMFSNVEGEKKTYKLSNSDDFEVSIGKRVLATEFVEGGKFPVYSANVITPFGTLDKSILNDFSVPSVLWGIDGDWMVNYIPENTPFMPTDHCGVLRVKNKEINARFIVDQIKKQGEELRFSRVNRASIERIKQITLSLPPLSVQNTLVQKAQGIEAKIDEAREVIDGASERKKAVMEREL